MFINKISISNFKSIYGTQEFDFRKLTGLNKLTGPVGAGKTTLCEAILYALYGQVKNQKIPSLVSWNTKEMEVAIELKSNNKLLYIKRGNLKQTEFFVDNVQIPAPSKRDIQDIINNYYDTPRMVVERMCIISFDASKMSLLSMTPSDSKQFSDDVFGFSVFTQYSDISNRCKLDSIEELKKLEVAISAAKTNIERLTMKMEEQLKSAKCDIDESEVKNNISIIKEKIKIFETNIAQLQSDLNSKIETYNNEIIRIQSEYDAFLTKKKEAEIEGKHTRARYEKIKSGKCEVCGHDIGNIEIDKINNKIIELTNIWKESNNNAKQKQLELDKLKQSIESDKSSIKNAISIYNKEINILNSQLYGEQMKLKERETRLNAVRNNYADMIEISNKELKELIERKGKLSVKNSNWAEMTELLTKTFRYNLLDQIVPQINNAIQTYITHTGLPFYIEFNEEFKSKIYSHYYKKEIPYSSLSTGQKKSVDMSIIFGILNCVISQTGFNVIILDELFSNMDADIRQTMLEILRTNAKDEHSIFVINHADMDDSYFDHKIYVLQKRSKITVKGDEVPINKSIYNIVF